MRYKLTKKQKRLMDFLAEFIAEHDYSPSYREIASGLGLKSPASVAEHIDNLVALGFLKREEGSARSLVIIDRSFPETTELFKQRLEFATDEESEILHQAAEILGLELEPENL